MLSTWVVTAQPIEFEEVLLFFHPDTMSLRFFAALMIFILAVIFRTVQRTYSEKLAVNISIGLFVFFLLYSGLIKSEWIQNSPFPRIPIAFFIVNGAAVAFALSPLGRRLADSLSLKQLILFQAFRLPLELILHSWAEQGVIPVTMTWNGSNFDVVTGLLAIAIGSFATNSRKAVWAFAIIGFALLLNVMRVAMMSSPLPFGWPVIPPLQLVFELPFAYIAPVCVASALAGHILLFRKLTAKKSN